MHTYKFKVEQRIGTAMAFQWVCVDHSEVPSLRSDPESSCDDQRYFTRHANTGLTCPKKAKAFAFPLACVFFGAFCSL